ncbi:MAG: trigger factor [Actinomycetota bacterium]|nr:trigger factor [Actinomycetota bacterium]
MQRKELLEHKLDILVTELPQRRVRLDITVPFSEVAKDLAKIKRDATNEVQLRGFRKHKTPFELAKPFVSKKKINNSFLEQVTPRLVNEALKQTKIEPAAFPRCEIASFEEGQPLVLRLFVPLKPEVKLGNYKDIKVWHPKLETSEADVEERLSYLRRACGKLAAKNGPITEGDIIQYNTAMVVDDHEIPSTATADLWLEIEADGPNGAISSALIGAKSNDARLVETYDGDGTQVTLKHNIKAVMEPVLPASDEDLLTRAADKYPDCKTVSVLRKRLRDELTAEKEEIARTFVGEEIRRKIVAVSQVEIAPELTETIVDGRIEETTRGLQEHGLTLQAHLERNELDEKTFRANLTQDTEFTMKANMLLEAIARKEKLEPTPEELSAAAREEGVVGPQGDSHDIFSFLETANPSLADEIRRKALHEKALAFLVGKVKTLNVKNSKRTRTSKTRSSGKRAKA